MHAYYQRRTGTSKAMRVIVFLISLFLSVVAFAEEQICSQLVSEVLSGAFLDKEFRSYSCPLDEGCTFETFSNKVKVEQVALEYRRPSLGYCAFFVTPETKGKQFPTLVYVGGRVALLQVLDDYESGLSIAKEGKNGLKNLIGRAHPEADSLVVTLYSWDGRVYKTEKVTCFKTVVKHGGRATKLVPIKCD